MKCGALWRRATVQVIGIAVLLGTVAVSGGCNYVAWVAQIIPQKIKAVYRLEDRPTLVMVEDPKHVFDDPTIVARISHEMTDALSHAHAISQLIDPGKVDSLIVSLGNDYQRVGIDQVGRAVGAQQVVHVHVDWALLYPQPGFFRPAAALEVKVIDVIGHRRLFPLAGMSGNDGGEALRGHMVKVQMGPRGGVEPGAVTDRAAWHTLASRMARDAARIFYGHYPRQPGEPFE